MKKDIRTLVTELHNRDPRAVARAISLVENNDPAADELLASLDQQAIDAAVVLGITGTPGVGKSTLTSALVSHYRRQELRVGIVAVDPSSPISGGALLGDRVRMMGHATDNDVVVRSMATRGRLGGLCASAGSAVRVMAASGCSPVIIETVGVGQSEMDIVRLADITMMVLAPGLGDDIQAMKAGLLEVADLLVVNKCDCPGAETLTMDMEAVLHARKNEAPGSRVYQTVAAESRGIGELALGIADLDLYFRNSGIQKSRRQASLQLEIVDWALELIKPELVKRIDTQCLDYEEPRRAALKLVREMFRGSDS